MLARTCARTIAAARNRHRCYSAVVLPDFPAPTLLDVKTWWDEHPHAKRVTSCFADHGYAVLPQLVTPSEIAAYRDACDALLCGAVDASRHRHDLGSNEKQVRVGWPRTCTIPYLFALTGW